MADEQISRALNQNSPIPAEELPRLFAMLLECKKESEMTKREEKKYESMKEVMIEEITGKYQFYENLFSKIFAERQKALKKDFQIIDEGMKTNDHELITAGLTGLSQLVSSSPITDLEKLRRLLG